MKPYTKYFKDQKIVIMGLGLLGRGIGVAKFLAEQGASLTITDLKTKKELAPALKKLRKFRNLTYVLGRHRMKDFSAGAADMIIKAASVPLDSPFIAEARKNNIPIKMDASLFLELAPKIMTIGFTGTRGKSTVTHLTFKIIETYLRKNKKIKTKVYLAGNVRGAATLPLLEKIRKGDIVVLELDSWQLQGFGDSKISPHIAGFTNLMADHMNYYGGDMKKYFLDKANIYKYQTAKDFLIVGRTVSSLIRKHGHRQSRLIETKPLPESWRPKLIGWHNLENIKLAVTAARLLKIPDSVIKKTVENFSGAPGRLEFIREFSGVKYYNDTTATIPEAAIAALRSFEDGHNRIILIGGGADKNLVYQKYAQTVPVYVKKLILLPGAATVKIKKALPGSFQKNIINVGSMKEAVKKAVTYSDQGDIVLLSPAAASFGPPPGGFKNEFDRGDQFVELVKKLK